MTRHQLMAPLPKGQQVTSLVMSLPHKCLALYKSQVPLTATLLKMPSQLPVTLARARPAHLVRYHLSGPAPPCQDSGHSPQNRQPQTSLRICSRKICLTLPPTVALCQAPGLRKSHATCQTPNLVCKISHSNPDHMTGRERVEVKVPRGRRPLRDLQEAGDHKGPLHKGPQSEWRQQQIQFHPEMTAHSPKLKGQHCASPAK